MSDEPRTRPPPPKSRSGVILVGWFVVSVLVCMASFTLIESGDISVWTALGAGVLLLAIVGPVTLKVGQWYSPDPDVEMIDLLTADAPREFLSALGRAEKQLEVLGFRLAGHLRISNAVPSVTLFVTLFEHAKEKLTAQVIMANAAVAHIRKTVNVISFTTDFNDATKLITSNSPQLSIIPNPRLREGSGSFPEIKRSHRLFQIHQASVARYGADALRLEPSTKDPAEFLRQSIRADGERFLDTGYYYEDADRGVYRPTWRGACLMAWKSTWPVKPIRQLIRKRRSRALLSELGVDH